MKTFWQFLQAIKEASVVGPEGRVAVQNPVGDEMRNLGIKPDVFHAATRMFPLASGEDILAMFQKFGSQKADQSRVVWDDPSTPPTVSGPEAGKHVPDLQTLSTGAPTLGRGSPSFASAAGERGANDLASPEEIEQYRKKRGL